MSMNGEYVRITDEDWGYGPPRYLTADRVRIAADALTATSYADLTAGVSLTALADASIYPEIWDEPDALEWVGARYEPLVPFLAAAARQNQAVIVWLD